MGNRQEIDHNFENIFYKNYHFIDMLEDSTFGQVKVYRKRQINYDYIIVLDKYIEGPDLQRIIKEMNVVKRLQLQQEQLPFLKIHHYTLHEKQLIECKLSFVRIYLQYCNFTLKNLIDNLIQQKKQFSYEQIMLVLAQTLKAYEKLKDISTNILIIKSQNIFLTMQGFLKFCPIKIKEWKQIQNAFCHALCDNSRQVHTTFEKTQRQFIRQLRNLLQQMLKTINPQTNMDWNSIKQLHQNLSMVLTLNELKQIIHEVQIYSFTFNNKESTQNSNEAEQTPNNGNSRVNYTHKDKVKVEIKDNTSKMSLKKFRVDNVRREIYPLF